MTHTINWIFKIVKVVFLTSKVQLLLFQKKVFDKGNTMFLLHENNAINEMVSTGGILWRQS